MNRKLFIFGLVALWSFSVYGLSTHSKNTKKRLVRLENALQNYYLDVGRYPTNKEGLKALLKNDEREKKWKGPYVRSDGELTDSWGELIRYVKTGKYFRLISKGPDKELLTDDDIELD